MTQQDLKTLNFSQMEEFVKGLGWPRYRADQILRWIYQKRAVDFSSMTDLSQANRKTLEAQAYISELKLIISQNSSDGTRKFLFGLEDGNSIETVLITDVTETGQRLTLCISTQVGCTLDCEFCLTGRMGLKRNLKAHELVDQMLAVESLLKPTGQHITNMVMMGMGEPLANFHQVVEAIHRISSPRGLGFSQRRITVSTAGLVPQIRLLGTLGLKVNLAISLNATTDETRNQIMGTINRKYPLKELLKACREYPLSPRRRLTFEYVLLKGVNDFSLDAQRLIKLLRGIPCKVNLIPYNEHPGSGYQRPSDPEVLRFQKILTDAHLDAFIRKSKGRDILAACGQLTSVPSST
jgi:23S rRNA (adenine2503-C2)-methyltransferase